MSRFDDYWRKTIDLEDGSTAAGQLISKKSGDGSLTIRECMPQQGDLTKLIPFRSARTTFYADETGDDRNEKQYDRLWRHQHDWLRDETSRRTHLDKLRVAAALATAVGITRYQRTRVREIVGSIDGRRFNQNGGIVGLALGAIAYVGDEEASRLKSFDARISGKDRFEEVCERHGVNGARACNKIKESLR
ncbi:hypothetical protein [Halobaculum litoreum]|uniref:hypothetical protein n=1 Tax=Halobaculum litoreum TaxID=3031998 RepID=UPI0024C26C6C|nr:hypothetical protein [Halobaculum sp. DT92]